MSYTILRTFSPFIHDWPPPPPLIFWLERTTAFFKRTQITSLLQENTNHIKSLDMAKENIYTIFYFTDLAIRYIPQLLLIFKNLSLTYTRAWSTTTNLALSLWTSIYYFSKQLRYKKVFYRIVGSHSKIANRNEFVFIQNKVQTNPIKNKYIHTDVH